MDDKQNQQIRLLIYLLILAVIFCVAYFLVYPKLKNARRAQIDYSIYSKLLKEKEDSLEKFNKVAAVYKQKKSDFKKIDQLLLEETNDKVFLLVQFEILASMNNMTMESFSFSEITSSEEDLGILPVNLSVRGKYTDFKNYLDSIAKNLPLMEVESIQFSPSGERSNLYTFILEISIYSKEVPNIQTQNQGTGNTTNQSQSGSATTTSETTPSPTSTINSTSTQTSTTQVSP